MSTFSIGDHFIVNDKKQPRFHEEEGVILATYPPKVQEPHSYETLVNGRPLILTAEQMQKIDETAPYGRDGTTGRSMPE